MSFDDLVKMRVEKAHHQDGAASRYLALAMVLLAIFHTLPALVQLFNQQAIAAEQLFQLRWVLFVFFMAGLHLVYAVYVYQVVDWSGVYTMAVFELICAIFFAVLCGGLWVEQGAGPFSNMLQIPALLKANAQLWCASLTGISGLVSYVAWREAARWRLAQ